MGQNGTAAVLDALRRHEERRTALAAEAAGLRARLDETNKVLAAENASCAALRGLRDFWKPIAAFTASSSRWFFVRGYALGPRVDEHAAPGERWPVACDRFEAPELAEDPATASAWCARAGMPTAGIEEARREPCAGCGSPALVVGECDDDYDAGYWSLYLRRLCLHCGALAEVAARHHMMPPYAGSRGENPIDAVFRAVDAGKERAP